MPRRCRCARTSKRFWGCARSWNSTRRPPPPSLRAAEKGSSITSRSAPPRRDVAITGPTPYLRPLRAARDIARSAVTIVDRRTARIYMMNGQGTTLEQEIVESEELKSNYGGWHGYEERSARAHADRVASRHFRATAEALFEIHKDKPIKYLMVGGHREHADDFVNTLHPYLRNLHVGNFTSTLEP